MKLGIIGLGLIGGSLGLALRSRSHYVIGISRHEETCALAIQKGIVDEASVDFSVLSAVEVIFICTPIGAIIPTVEQLKPILSPDTILTDVGSVKAPIVEAMTPLWSNFIGGHPMAGTAQQGIEAAQLDLFTGTKYVLTPTENTPVEAQKTLTAIVQDLGTELITCSPETHDQTVAWISHLPVFVSSSLIASCVQETDREVVTLAQKLASSGFRDTSRVGGGNPELGVMMAKSNQKAVLRSLRIYRQQLDKMIHAIEEEDWEQVERMLGETREARSLFTTKK
ncbi:prephenate/arogenate dehydrogenase [Dactylococcopsis salina]|uniref:Prephenate dehydrogenase n=1 Tax=Dactylococcopsis salina (strain PCC 8305) TaxID=13035 RepID=K9YSH9_DACS8|nr:prephenate/arogenate dehydrogenase [Dactylococcopsis salina]AFZ49462.1 prephenate dehydrogenase [Dactylococcopsis salina PCC 8305]